MCDKKANETTAVLVTYADRWRLLREVLDQLLHHQSGIAAVVLVDNGTTYGLSERLVAEGFDRVRVVRMSSNQGSAAGFAAGIDEAMRRTNSAHIWLLDDDNKPGFGCLEGLLCAYHLLGENPYNVLLAHRSTRREQVEALWRGRQLCVRANAFLGFHLLDLPGKVAKQARKCWRQTDKGASPSPMVSIGYAPYGGLLFHRIWIERVGLPDVRFFLYGDDYDFTSRLVRAGARIVLCGFCEVHDLEESWSLKSSRAPAVMSKGASAMRAFYSVRNRVFWEWSSYASARWVYMINALLYLAYLFISALIAERAPVALGRRVRLIVRAISDGVRGRLGKVTLAA